MNIQDRKISLRDYCYSEEIKNYILYFCLFLLLFGDLHHAAPNEMKTLIPLMVIVQIKKKSFLLSVKKDLENFNNKKKYLFIQLLFLELYDV